MEKIFKKFENIWETIAPFLFGIAFICGSILAYNAYKRGNEELFAAWMTSAGMAGGAMGAYIRIKEIKDENDIPRS